MNYEWYVRVDSSLAEIIRAVDKGRESKRKTTSVEPVVKKDSKHYPEGVTSIVKVRGSVCMCGCPYVFIYLNV